MSGASRPAKSGGRDVKIKGCVKACVEQARLDSMPRAPDPRLTVKLHDRELADIDAEARERRVSRSEVVRERLRRSNVSKASKGSIWERMRDLVVQEDSAPADLSSNKSRMRGYGRSRTG